MDLDMAPCLKCRSEVPVGATICTNCDYDVRDHDRPRLLLGLLGTVMSLTVVFAPVGIPLLLWARHHEGAKNGTVTQREHRDTLEDLTEVLRYHLEIGTDRSNI